MPIKERSVECRAQDMKAQNTRVPSGLNSQIRTNWTAFNYSRSLWIGQQITLLPVLGSAHVCSNKFATEWPRKCASCWQKSLMLIPALFAAVQCTKHEPVLLKPSKKDLEGLLTDF